MKALLISLLALSSPALAQEVSQEAPAELQEAPQHPHRALRNAYLWETFGPPGMVMASLGAALGQVQNTPDEWGRSEHAYFKRMATEYGESAISSTTRFSLARWRDEDPGFRPCGCTGVRRRVWHAVVSPVSAYRVHDGGMQFSVAAIAGTAASSVVSANTWKPRPQTVGTEAAHIGTDLLSSIVVDLFREFLFHDAPD
ncbi:MAG TPA: hypothetical protein VN628_03595 [Vicinamibacterales bacterium]|nr:hypothetical protein [Vicinamibacterales bacterium]